MKFAVAVRTLFRESKSAFSFEVGTRTAVAFGLGATSIVFGVWFAIQDFERVNTVISFIAGCVTGPLIVFLPYASIFEGAALTCFALSLLGFDLRTYEQARAVGESIGRVPPSSLAVFFTWAFAGLLFSTGVYVASHIPIVGRQLIGIISGFDL